MHEIMGPGAALFDYDGDGDLDVFLPQGEGRSRLFRNDLTVGAADRRTLQFTDVTDRAGITLASYGMGTAVGDYDNDGDLDLFVTSFGADTLYRNNGDGTFTDVTKAAGVSDALWSTSAAFLDFDRDSDLDLFVANYLDFTIADNKICHDPVGARDYCSPRAYRSVPDRLYRNEGRGRFVNVTEPAGIARADGNGLGVSVGDYNGDGWLDLYVANDATANQLWINRKDGTFVDEGLLSGAALSAAGNPEGSMGIASGDFDADGDEDLFVTNIIAETFVLYVNDGKGAFDDARVRAGPGAAHGRVYGFWHRLVRLRQRRLARSLHRQRRRQHHRVAAWTAGAVSHEESALPQHRRGRFEETSAAGGPAFARAEISRGAAFGDVDNDGDIDVLVTTNNGPVRLLLNQSDTRNHWLQVQLRHDTGERFGMGARIGIERAGQPTLWRRVKTDGSYLSASDIRVHVGLGASAQHRCRRRRMARRRARALEGRGRGSARDASAREREVTTAP